MYSEDPKYGERKFEDLKYEEKIRELQTNISSLRMSRRILMSLLESVQNEHKKDQKKLLEENKKLKRSNHNFAGLLWEKNKRIRELENILQQANLN